MEFLGRGFACLEEIAYQRGFISREELLRQGERLKSSKYGQYILGLLNKPKSSR
jgi:glucose-1-phosphate thymidylyltransferase